MQNILTAIKLAFLTLLGCSVIYPLAVLATARVLSAEKAEGSLVRDGSGRVLGSRLIAQRFRSPRYLWPRPSAVNYNAEAAGGSNLAPASPVLAERAKQTLAEYAMPDGVCLPADLVAASGSGLDPHISEQGAMSQAIRIARARATSQEAIQKIIAANAFTPDWTNRDRRIVNVLEVNLCLDAQTATTPR